MSGQLTRPRSNRMIAGVAAGIANTTGLDVNLVRIATVVLALCTGGLGLVAYIVGWVVIPES